MDFKPYKSYTETLPTIMKKILFPIIIMFLFASCDTKQNSSDLDELNKKLSEKENQVSELQNRIKLLENEIKSSGNWEDYYRFILSDDADINVAQRLAKGTQKQIDQKSFKDTLDKSINYVYEHTSKIIQTTDPFIESVLRDLDEDKSAWGSDFFVRVISFYNGQSLPLENENEKTDIHIIIRPTELGYENKTFVISDFYNVKLDTLISRENDVRLEFTHGVHPRKKEWIIIKPELVRFEKK